METTYTITDEEYKDIYSKVPRLCVDVVIKNEQGILMTLRDIAPYKNIWHIPGGAVHYGETVEVAAKRIAKEELGVEIETRGLAGYLEYPSDNKSRSWGWPIALEMLCVVKSGEFKLDQQAREWKFFKTPPADSVEEQKKIFAELLKA